MPRIKINLPGDFSFSTTIPVRITDINYGGHVGNDSILSIIHEARVQYLNSFGYEELNLDGAGLIMADVMIEFKHELFYGNQVKVSVKATEFTKIAFTLYYKLEALSEGDENKLIAIAQTGMVCYDYTNKKIMAIPETVLSKLSSGN